MFSFLAAHWYFIRLSDEITVWQRKAYESRKVLRRGRTLLQFLQREEKGKCIYAFIKKAHIWETPKKAYPRRTRGTIQH